MGGLALDRPLFVQTLLHVILPQALRLTIAPLTNRTIAITKGTALGTVVALHEILGMASLGDVELLQSLAADDGRGSLPRPVPAGRRGGSLGRNAVLMEEIVQSFFNGEIAEAALPIVLAGLLTRSCCRSSSCRSACSAGWRWQSSRNRRTPWCAGR